MNDNIVKKIMIVDDDNFMIDMYSLKFKERGFVVYASLDPKRALEKLNEGFVPNIILFDIIMPEMDGFEFLENVKKIDLENNIIKIALSNQWEEEVIERIKKMGVDDYIIKANMVPSEVLDKVEEIIKNKIKI